MPYLSIKASNAHGGNAARAAEMRAPHIANLVYYGKTRLINTLSRTFNEDRMEVQNAMLSYRTCYFRFFTHFVLVIILQVMNNVSWILPLKL